MQATMDATSLLRLSARWTEVEGLTHEAIMATAQLAGEAVKEAGVPIIAEHTPKSPWEGPQQTKRLYETTEGGVETASSPGGAEAVINFRQDKRTRDGRFLVARLVIGGRAAIVTPPGGWPSGAKALWTPWGPRKSVKAADPNDYPAEAMKELRPVAKEILVRGAFGFTAITAHRLTSAA